MAKVNAQDYLELSYKIALEIKTRDETNCHSTLFTDFNVVIVNQSYSLIPKKVVQNPEKAVLGFGCSWLGS